MSAVDVAPAAGFFSKERIIAGPGFNRWLVPPAALAIHLCIGMAYGFSVFWLPLSRAVGITTSVACPKTMGVFDQILATGLRLEDLHAGVDFHPVLFIPRLFGRHLGRLGGALGAAQGGRRGGSLLVRRTRGRRPGGHRSPALALLARCRRDRWHWARAWVTSPPSRHS